MARNEFKGFGDWVEIFRGGKQVDSKGREHDGDAMIDRAVASFDAGKHEPPLVLGHPADNGPAFGWVEELKAATRDGAKVLLAKFRQVAPEFEEQVRAGRWKKRSAAFYRDGRLRHVGFLGGTPPAVQGLADLRFDEGEADTFEFADPWSWGVIGRLFGQLREWIIAKEGIEAADRLLPAWDIDQLKKEAERPGEEASVVAYAEPAQEGIMPKTIEELQQELAAEKAARQEAEARAASAEASFSEQQQAARRREVDAFIDQGVAAGTILPVWKTQGLGEFMLALDGEAATFEFSEGKKESKSEWFKGFLASFASHPLFKEMAPKAAPAADAQFSEDEKTAHEIAGVAMEEK
jgi:hypothetical protein